MPFLFPAECEEQARLFLFLIAHAPCVLYLKIRVVEPTLLVSIKPILCPKPLLFPIDFPCALSVKKRVIASNPAKVVASGLSGQFLFTIIPHGFTGDPHFRESLDWLNLSDEHKWAIIAFKLIKTRGKICNTISAISGMNFGF